MMNLKQRCSAIPACRNRAQVIGGRVIDFCRKHNALRVQGIVVKCWRCGDR